MRPSLRFAVILAVALMILPTASRAEEAADSVKVGVWKTSLLFDFTTTQSAYSDSWVGGEAGSVNWVSNLNGTAENQLKDWFNLRSTLKMSFGQTYTQDAETKTWAKPQKSTDLIDFENVGRFTMHRWVDPYAAFRLESQFYDGRNRNKKLYLSPMKLTVSAGGLHQFYVRGDDFIHSRAGLAVVETITKYIADSTAVPGGWEYSTESENVTAAGVELVTDAKLTLRENLHYTGKLTLFKALSFSEKDAVAGTPAEDDWKAIDVNLENIVTAKITKILTVTLYTQFLYDKEITKSIRVKETLALGVAFSLI